MIFVDSYFVEEKPYAFDSGTDVCRRYTSAKADPVRALTDAFVETAGSTHDEVDVILTDVEQSDWGQGGELFSEKKRD